MRILRRAFARGNRCGLGKGSSPKEFEPLVGGGIISPPRTSGRGSFCSVFKAGGVNNGGACGSSGKSGTAVGAGGRRLAPGSGLNWTGGLGGGLVSMKV